MNQEEDMDLGRSFKYMFEDEGWISKVLIGGIQGIIPIVNFVVYGYMLEIIHNVAAGQELPLPKWDEFGTKFMKGLMVFLASLIYALPIIVLSIVFAIVSAVIGAGASSSSRDASNAAGGIIGLCAVVYYCVVFIYALLVYGFLFVPGLMRYADGGEFGVFFQFGQNWSLVSSNLGGYVVMILVSVVALIVAEIVGTIACGIGLLFTMFWAYLVSGHLMGQYWKENKVRV
jgi:hypothetical protein